MTWNDIANAKRYWVISAHFAADLGGSMRGLLAALGILGVLLGPTAAAAQPATCDRACMSEMVDRFLGAVLAKDPTRAPLAIGFRQTQNSVLTPPGSGAWQTVSAIGQVQRRYFDPVSGNAAFFGVVTDRGE